MKKLPFFLPSAGCRGRCVYCDQSAITGVYSVPSAEDVSAVLKRLDTPREICFFGGSFCRFEYEKIKGYLDAVIRFAPLGSRIRFSTYPGDLADPSIRDLVSKYPIACIEFGIPSLDPKVLALCKREADPGAILNDIKTVIDECLPLGVQMMIGLPGQDEKSSMEDLETLAELKGPLSWDLRLYPCLVLKGTVLQDMAEKGAYAPLNLDRAVKWGGAFIDKALSFGFNPIRIGLQQTDSLSFKVKDGPYHPALGEMIATESLILKLLKNRNRDHWTVPYEHLSKFTGHGSFGLRRLAELSNITHEAASAKLSFFPDPLAALPKTATSTIQAR